VYYLTAFSNADDCTMFHEEGLYYFICTDPGLTFSSFGRVCIYFSFIICL
jgi:hypothetical protein